ncbi:MAG: N-acyl homoserine lactonase family protein [Sphingomonas sp.]|uniref:N-acyl homoserine lactonase family protein n=1 Tax=Sphingomonas sp. TaxID=28214 RepID=UPI0025EB2631|nr:N-acyl homoserine lactonase family protein [Sphingomonas sp.]MBY0284362.1 N-acyl homoserine lactonase family protein [Sphingomonas sp.]
MKRALVMLVAGTVLAGACAFAASGKPPAEMKLWRLDCGAAQVNDLNVFNDTRAFPAKSSMRFTSSCYLIKHGDSYLLWDTGLSTALKGVPTNDKDPISATLTVTIPEQLAKIGVKPSDISIIGISHYHFDHTGQAGAFPQAKLLIGKGDYDSLAATPPKNGADPTPLKNWIGGPGASEPVAGDKDVFGDGSVTMIDLPGHTPGHHALLLKLPKLGAVLLSGDQVHLRENLPIDGVPTFNYDRAQTIASYDRFKKLAANTKALVIIQHDARDIPKLPAFPAAAE